jgi:hypothetical protein
MKKNKLLPTKKAQKVSTDEISPLRGYASSLRDLKTHIRSAQIKATFAVNSEMISLYGKSAKALSNDRKTPVGATKCLKS